MKYRVTVTETLSREIVVEADSIHEAEKLVMDEWNNAGFDLESEGIEFTSEKVGDEQHEEVNT